LFAIEQTDQNEQFSELYDSRNAPRASRTALQSTYIAWNPNEGNIDDRLI
jgi:hypothetical protein